MRCRGRGAGKIPVSSPGFGGEYLYARSAKVYRLFAVCRGGLLRIVRVCSHNSQQEWTVTGGRHVSDCIYIHRFIAGGGHGKDAGPPQLFQHAAPNRLFMAENAGHAERSIDHHHQGALFSVGCCVQFPLLNDVLIGFDDLADPFRAEQHAFDALVDAADAHVVVAHRADYSGHRGAVIILRKLRSILCEIPSVVIICKPVAVVVDAIPGNFSVVDPEVGKQIGMLDVKAAVDDRNHNRITACRKPTGRLIPCLFHADPGQAPLFAILRIVGCAVKHQPVIPLDRFDA